MIDFKPNVVEMRKVDKELGTDLMGVYSRVQVRSSCSSSMLGLFESYNIG